MASATCSTIDGQTCVPEFYFDWSDYGRDIVELIRGCFRPGASEDSLVCPTMVDDVTGLARQDSLAECADHCRIDDSGIT